MIYYTYKQLLITYNILQNNGNFNDIQKTLKVPFYVIKLLILRTNKETTKSLKDAFEKILKARIKLQKYPIKNAILEQLLFILCQ